VLVMIDCRILKYLLVIISIISISFLNLIMSGIALGETKIIVEPGESIQSAIDQAGSGYIIEVESGIYEESIEVNKRLKLTGIDTGKGAPTIQNVHLTADHSEISGFRISDHAGFGIAVTSNSNIITNNDLEACMTGIFLNGVHGNLVANNDVRVVCEGWYGLLSGSFSLGGGDCIQLLNSYNNTIKNNTVANGFIGIYLDKSMNNLVVANNATGNKNGIGLFSATGNTLQDNIIRKNSDDGIGLVKFSNDTIITGNTIEDNGNSGIWLKDSSHNTIYLNKLRNSRNVRLMDYHSEGSFSQWQSPEPVHISRTIGSIKGYAGNYWSDYKGKDLDGDGIGDEAYSFEGGRDSYPLMRPWEG
jgi:parallel beta-helix repeat protein